MKTLAMALALSLAAPASAALPSQTPAHGLHAMVATEQRYATQAGLDVLKRGGNAIDAAIAVAYALAVVDPCCGNIGGGGFMLVRMRDGRERFIDFREKAPLRASARLFLDGKGNVRPGLSTKGYLAVGVPGTVMGMERARAEFATMPRAALMAPAIRLARGGFVLTQGDLLPFAGAPGESYSGAATFADQPNAAAIFLDKGKAPQPGRRLRQPQLAHSLELISAGGANAFYRGQIARKIVAASTANGGILSLEDFARYTAGESQPLHCGYRGYEIVAAPPPSSGGTTLCEILDIASAYPLGRYGWNSEQSTHDVVEAERRAYADRNTYLGDPAFVRNPIAQLLDASYIARLRASIAPQKATPSVDVHPGLGPVSSEETDTTHFSIVDKWGNAAAVTYTINDWFGAKVIASDTGFFLNDEMDDFTAKPGVENAYHLVQGPRNAIAPGKRPLSSMTPTIVLKDGKLFMVTGSPGGSRIITVVANVLQNVIDYGMNVQQAVDAPRFHMQWLPDRVDYEPGAFTPDAMQRLQSDGYTFNEVRFWGSAQAVLIDPKTGIRYGGTDRRHPAGAAIGY